MRYLPLTKGLTAVVDDEDFDRVGSFKWKARVESYATRRTHYASRTYMGEDGRMHEALLHRVILRARRGFLVDHINGNGLDCRRANLRLATHLGNSRNRRKDRKPSTSKFKGVCRRRGCSSWIAQIRVGDNKRLHLGSFRSEVDAAMAYDIAARREHREFATLNFPRHGESSAALPADLRERQFRPVRP